MTLKIKFTDLPREQLEQMAALFGGENLEHCIALGDFNVRGETRSGDSNTSSNLRNQVSN